jgi:exodeoxyribonuclease VII large subunit
MTLPLWGPAPSDKAAPRRLTLVRLAGEIARSLSVIGRVAVEGEVYRPQSSRSGWVFFVLRDRAAQLPVACPARHTRRCRTVNGERALVVGTLVWGNDRGQLVLEAEEVTPVGEGAVAALIAETRARLAAEGLLDRARRPLPRLPAAIGVVCGADAAVRKDIESVVAARFPGYPLSFAETTVSGPGAAQAIVEALSRLGCQPGVEVVILARGGGDATSLLPWSDEELCRAVAACPVAVVSAIGHESDRPLCDEVADLRCGTPSIAAHSVVPDRRALEAELSGMLERSVRYIASRRDLVGRRLERCETTGALAVALDRARRRMGNAGERLEWAHPATAAHASRQRLAACDWRRPFASHVASGRQRLDALQRHARSLSPQHVLDRGFAVVRRADGTVVRGPDEVKLGDSIAVTVARGIITATVDDAGHRGRQ